MERQEPKDKTFIAMGAKTLGTYKPGDVVDIHIKGSPVWQRVGIIRGARILSIDETGQMGNPSIKVEVEYGTPEYHPRGIHNTFSHQFALGGGTAAIPH